MLCTQSVLCLQCFDTVGWKRIWPVKNWVMTCWRGYLSGARCKWLHMVQLMSLPPHCLTEVENGWTFLVPAYPGCPGKEAVKRVSVCLSTVHVCLSASFLKQVLRGVRSRSAHKYDGTDRASAAGRASVLIRRRDRVPLAAAIRLSRGDGRASAVNQDELATNWAPLDARLDQRCRLIYEWVCRLDPVDWPCARRRAELFYFAALRIASAFAECRVGVCGRRLSPVNSGGSN